MFYGYALGIECIDRVADGINGRVPGLSGVVSPKTGLGRPQLAPNRRDNHLAQVKSSRVRVRRGSDGGYRMTTRYEPQVIYRYLANGNSHESKRLYVGDTVGYSGPGPAERILTRYPVGMPVTVYYNPNNPAEATLSPQTGWATTISWLMSAFLFLMTAMVIYAIISNGPIT